MRPFDYQRADDADSAVAAVMDRPDAVYLGGGTNLIDHMKLRIANPGLVVDVSGLPFDQVEEIADGSVRIGAACATATLPPTR